MYQINFTITLKLNDKETKENYKKDSAIYCTIGIGNNTDNYNNVYFPI